jgi:hypothetical protein
MLFSVVYHDGKTKLKEHGFGFLEKGTNCTKFLSPTVVIDQFVRRCDINFHT